MSTIEKLNAEQAHRHVAALGELLRDSVEGGASVGYILPLPQAEVEQYWHGVIAEVAAGTKILLIAWADGEIAGTVQLELATKPNGRHRAEVQKLLVLRRFRGRGIAGQLMSALEEEARAAHRTLLILDTIQGDTAERLYPKWGFVQSGIIPNFATFPDGRMGDTVVFYKLLE